MTRCDECGDIRFERAGSKSLAVGQYSDGKLVFGICRHGVTVVDERDDSTIKDAVIAGKD